MANHQSMEERTTVRNGKGRFQRTLEATERGRDACRMRVEGMTLSEIGDVLGITPTGVHNLIKQTLSRIPVEAVDELRKYEMEKLDRAEQAALEILRRRHEVVFRGEETGIQDDGPALAALDRLLKISESRRRLLGIDAPVVVEQLPVEIRINGINMTEV